MDFFIFEQHDAGGKVKLQLSDDVKASAEYSPCGRYRYELHRRWNQDQPTKSIMFLMMNPSTATEFVDDPTVKKCRYYANRWDFNHLIIGNVFAYRATNPKELLKVDDPQGTENLYRLQKLLTEHNPFLVCAWGRIPKRLSNIEEQAMQLVKGYEPHVLRLNKVGKPYHPLYLPNDTTSISWSIY